MELQEQAAASFAGNCNGGLQLGEEHGAAAGQLQPRPVFMQMMTHVLELAHAAAAAGAVPSLCSAALRQPLTSTSGASFHDVIVPLTQDAVRCCVGSVARQQGCARASYSSKFIR